MKTCNNLAPGEYTKSLIRNVWREREEELFSELPADHLFKRTKTAGSFLYENHKNDRFRIFGAPKCCPGKTVVLECVSEADETICTGWEVIAHSRFKTFFMSISTL